MQLKFEICALVFCFGIVLILSFFYFTSDKYKLKQKGYYRSEIELLTSELSDQQMDAVLTFEHHIPIQEIKKQKKFKQALLYEYIEFYLSYPKQKPKQVVLAVLYQFPRQKNFQIDRLNRYIAYQQKYGTLLPLQVTTFVNHDIDEQKLESIEPILAIYEQPYFIENRFLRYVTYYQKNTRFQAKTIVRNVNANIDFPYYTNTSASQLTDNNLVLTNKYYYLDTTYQPDDLVKVVDQFQVRKEVKNAYQKMSQAAKKEGLSFHMNSAFRSAQLQKEVYQEYRIKNGQAYADKYASRPGFSEHQTGLAIDITTRRVKFNQFDETDEFKWLEKHAHEYGFILRYPKGLQAITGYNYEPWHYRYVGIEVATKIKELNITFEEYYAYYIEQKK